MKIILLFLFFLQRNSLKANFRVKLIFYFPFLLSIPMPSSWQPTAISVSFPIQLLGLPRWLLFSCASYLKHKPLLINSKKEKWAWKVYLCTSKHGSSKAVILSIKLHFYVHVLEQKNKTKNKQTKITSFCSYWMERYALQSFVFVLKSSLVSQNTPKWKLLIKIYQITLIAKKH